tara:strand:- start:296 stop:2248 length:1953 start_codon:yes stop_codon:yes gene_type:complete
MSKEEIKIEEIKIEELKFETNNSNNSNNTIKEGFNNWLDANQIIIQNILKDYTRDGIKRDGSLSATTYNDYYKFSMLPVIRYIETNVFKNRPIYVTFGVNIRDTDYRQKILEDTNLQQNIFDALTKLKNRKFDRTIFKNIIKDKNLNLSEDDINDICGLEDNPRSLVQDVYLNGIAYKENKKNKKNKKNNNFQTQLTENINTNRNEKIIKNPGNDVIINMFKMKDFDGEYRIFIEASGPWHKVTWLETSMMQCVYEVLLRDKLNKNTNINEKYIEWLKQALLRCYKSIDQVNDQNKKENLKKIGRDTKPIHGALFTGRRTGGYLFMLIQNLLVGEKLNHFLGTSSVDAYYDLNQILKNINNSKNKNVQNLAPKFKNIKPAGTHAHELSMVCASLFGGYDNLAGLPLSQLLGHYLYYLKSSTNTNRNGNKLLNKIPMLPDTLGTDAFLYAANLLTIPENMKNKKPIKFIDIISSARQDSGTLLGFIKILRCHGFDGPVMASEIENISDIKKALAIKRINGSFPYEFFGAGGFFGDSLKAHDKDAKNISMAVKAVRVFKDNKETNYYPIKTGNSNSISKKEINRTLVKNNANRIFNDALKIKDLQKVDLDNAQGIFENLLRDTNLFEVSNKNNIRIVQKKINQGFGESKSNQ